MSTPAAERVIRQVLLDAITRSVDVSLFDATIAGSTDQPASLTHGLSAISATGATADAIRTDLGVMIDGITADMAQPLFVMRPASALRLALAGITSDNGQSIGGVPIHRSISIPEGTVILLDLAALVFAGGSDMIADASEDAAVELSTTPTGGATNLVSLWQNNLAAIRLELYFNFRMIRDGAIAILTGAEW